MRPFFGYCTGSEEIDGGGIQSLQLLEQSCYAGFRYHGSTLFIKGFSVDGDRVFRLKEGYHSLSRKLLGRRTSCKARTKANFIVFYWLVSQKLCPQLVK